MIQKLKAIIYSLLSVFFILLAKMLYQNGKPNICGYLYIGVISIIGGIYLLKNLYQICKNIKNNYYIKFFTLTISAIVLTIANFINLVLVSLKDFIKNLLVSSKDSIKNLPVSSKDFIKNLPVSSKDFIKNLFEIFLSLIKKYFKFIIITVFVINLIFYFDNYDKFQNYMIDTIIFFIGIFIGILTAFLLWFYKEQVLIHILTIIITITLSFLLGLLSFTDFSIASVIFLFGLLFAIIENIEKFIKLDNYYPKEIVTLENDDKIKRNKLVLNLFIGLLFISTYSFCKILITNPTYKEKILEYTKLNKLYEPLAIGLLVLIILEFLTILFIYIFSKLLESISNHSKQYSNENIAELMYSILTFGINKDVKPKVIDEIVIGYDDIDQVDPKVFITNIREIPKDIHILLSKFEDDPTIRKLLVIYPNKEVYSYKLSISKNIVKRISEIKSEETVNKQKE